MGFYRALGHFRRLRVLDLVVVVHQMFWLAERGKKF